MRIHAVLGGEEEKKGPICLAPALEAPSQDQSNSSRGTDDAPPGLAKARELARKMTLAYLCRSLLLGSSRRVFSFTTS